MEDQSVKLLNHCYKGAQMGIIALGQMLPYCKSKEVYDFVEASARRYQEFAKETSANLRARGADPKNVCKCSVYCAVKVVKWRCKRRGSDGNILEQVRDGAVKSVAACDRYLKMYCGADADAIEVCNKLSALSSNVDEESYSVSV